MNRRNRKALALSVSLTIPAVIGSSFNPARAGSGTWTNLSSGLWSNAGNWTLGNIADGIGATADFSTLNITADNTVTLDANHTLGAILFSDTTPSNNWFVNGTSTLTLATSVGTPTISVTGLGIANSKSATINAGITGTQGFTKVGNGALVLGGGVTNTLSGGITVAAGYLATLHGADLKNVTGGVTVNSGATFSAFQGFDTNAFANTFTLSGTGATINTIAYGALNISSNGTLNGNISLAADARISHDFNNAVINGTISGTNTNLELSTLQNSGQPDLLVNGSIQTGTGNVTISGVTGSQGVTLAGSNAYTGNTVVKTLGLLRASNANNLGAASSNIQLAGGTLDLRTTANTNFSHNVLVTANSVLQSDRTVAASAAVTDSLGTLTTQGGTLTVTPGANVTSGIATVSFAGTTVGTGSSGVVVNTSTGVGAVLSLGTVSRAAGSGVLDFSGSGTLVVGNTANQLLGGWATVGGTAFALVNGSNNVVAYTPTAQDDPSAWVAGQDISESAGFNTNTVAPSSINSLRFSAAATSTVNIGSSSTLSIATGGILITGTSTRNISGGTLTGSAGGDLIINQTGASTAVINSVIANNGAASGLTKAGVGTLILTGANIYTGGTTIASGTLQGNTTSIQGNILDNGTLLIAQTTSGSLTGNITGSGAFVKTNTGVASAAGVVTVSGSNTFTGGASVLSGTVKLGSNTALGTGLILVSGTAGNSAFLDLNGTSPSNNFNITGDDYLWSSSSGTAVISGNVAISSFARLGNANSNIAGTDNITVNGVVSGTTGLNKYGPGVVALNNTSTYAGYTVVNNGTLRASEGVGLPTGTNLTLSGGVLELGTDFNRTLGASAGSVIFSSAADGLSAFGAPISVSIGGAATPTSLVWGSTANFNPTTLTLNAASANNTLTFQNAVDLNGSDRTIIVGAASAIANGTLSNASGTAGITKQGSGTLIFNAANSYNGTTTISAGTLQMGNAGTTGVIPGNVTDNANLAFNRSDSTLSFSGAISGSGNVTQNGSGTLILAAGNSYAGTTNVNAGVLKLGNATALGNTTQSAIVASGATLDEAGFPQGSKPVTLAGSGVGGIGALYNSSSTSNAAVGAVTLAADATIGVSSNAFSARFDITGGATSVNGGTFVLSKAGPGSLRINSGAFTVGGINILGGSLAVLANSNVLIPGRPVNVSSGAALFLFNVDDLANTTFAAGGVLEDNTGSNTLGGTVTLTGPGAASIAYDQALTLNATARITGAGGLNTAGNASSTLVITNSSNDWTGGTTIAVGTVQIGNGGTSGVLPGNITDNATLAFNRSDTYTVTNTITGSGALVQSGSGTVVLNSASVAYAGLTTISAGTLQVGAGGTSGKLSNGSIANNAALAFNRADTYTAANAINGTGSVNQIGAGTTILSGTSSYSGATSVTNGTLDITGSLTSSTAFTVDSTAANANLVLDSAGAIPASSTVTGIGANAGLTANANQTLASINSAGSVSVASGATLNATSSLHAGPINSNGSLNVNGGSANLVGTVNGTGTLAVTGSANLTATYVRQGGLSVGSGATAVIAHDNQSATGGTPIGTSAVTTLSVDAAGTLDLTNNGIIVTDTTQFGAIQSSLATAYAAGWASPGITSSTAAAHTADHGVGYALASAIGSTSFNGITFADAVIARYTLLGDTNLKGGVDLGDYTKVITNLGKTGTVWSDGNFDYSGTVGLGDYTKVILALGRTDATALNDTALNGTAGPSAKQVRAASSALTLKAATPAVAPAATATDVHLVVNTASGLVTLISAVSGSQAIITAYTVKSPSGSLVKFKNSGSKYLGSAFQNNPGVFYSSSNGNTYNNWTGIKNTSTIIGEGFGNNYIATNDTTWTNYTLSSGGYALGAMFKTLSAGGVQDLSFQWDDKALNTFTSVVDYVGGTVPEPTSVSLIAMGAVGLLGRRRRRVGK